MNQVDPNGRGGVPKGLQATAKTESMAMDQERCPWSIQVRQIPS